MKRVMASLIVIVASTTSSAYSAASSAYSASSAATAVYSAYSAARSVYSAYSAVDSASSAYSAASAAYSAYPAVDSASSAYSAASAASSAYSAVDSASSAASAAYSAYSAVQVGAMVRGSVTDEAGQPIPDVKVEINFQGTRDQKPRTFTQATNNKGYFTRVGLPDGPYKITFSKDGYDPTTITTNISLGGLSDLGTVPLRARKDAAPEGRPAAAAPAPPAAPPETPAAAPVDAAALSQEQERFKQTFRQALEAGRAGRLDEAEALYKQILAKAPDLAVAHFNLGFVYRQKKDWTSAETEYRKTIELQPDSSAAYVALAGVYQLQGQTDRAVALLTDAAPRFEQDAEFQRGLGVVLFDSGASDAAAAAFRKAAAIDASNPEPQYYLGVIAVQQNRLREAIEHLERYVAATGQDPRNLQRAQELLKALQKRL